MVVLIVSLILVSDRMTKAFFSHLLAAEGSIPVIKGFFHLTLVHNRGAAFGMLRGQTLFFILASVIAVFFILFHMKKSTAVEKCALSLILAGAAGNLIDRVLYGHVVDFIDIHIDPYFYWPVFNVADTAITVGACMLGWLLLRQAIPEKK
ncbi:MAG TPA: signal peptidase II [Candidatus Omnitrophota bacterium]|mgnify:CR=1 FL=1|nr:signal peptidase II [Candidatus Omnitrophota bacterium]HQO38293.1 signal peptidase II [Candidatus Omnitrophota bacterium]HQQ06193.1 signal peptidase II [Candidatus Omnitrophota bacterium]